jgi:hypothetical protein
MLTAVGQESRVAACVVTVVRLAFESPSQQLARTIIVAVIGRDLSSDVCELSRVRRPKNGGSRV